MNNIKYISEPGIKNPGEIRVYALSTCAFCKKALRFLRDNSISFSYVFVDELGQDVKERLKAELREKFREDVGFPFLTMDDSKVIVGFNEEKYTDMLLK